MKGRCGVMELWSDAGFWILDARCWMLDERNNIWNHPRGGYLHPRLFCAFCWRPLVPATRRDAFGRPLILGFPSYRRYAVNMNRCEGNAWAYRCHAPLALAWNTHAARAWGSAAIGIERRLAARGRWERLKVANLRHQWGSRQLESEADALHWLPHSFCRRI